MKMESNSTRWFCWTFHCKVCMLQCQTCTSVVTLWCKPQRKRGRPFWTSWASLRRSVVEKYTLQTSYQLALQFNTPLPRSHTKGTSTAWGQHTHLTASALTWIHCVQGSCLYRVVLGYSLRIFHTFLGPNLPINTCHCTSDKLERFFKIQMKKKWA